MASDLAARLLVVSHPINSNSVINLNVPAVICRHRRGAVDRSNDMRPCISSAHT